MSFCLVFFFSFPGDVGGLLRALYIVPIYTDTHGFQIGVCLWGLRAGSAPGTLLPEDPFLAGEGGGGRAVGLGWGLPLQGREDELPLPWALPQLEEVLGGRGPSFGPGLFPFPLYPPCP